MTAQTTTGDPQLTITAVPGISLMSNQVRNYDWGSSTALAQLQNRIPSGDPEAELWMGAHPSAPSDLVLDDGTRLPLPTLLERDAASVLGPAVAAHWEGRLPFLLKILAIERPISLQVHPDGQRAREVYVPDGDTPYVDAYHKPEMLTALETTEMLYGFRPAPLAAELIGRLETERLADLVRALRAGGDDASLLHAALATLLAWPMTDRAALVAEVAAGSRRATAPAASSADHADAFGWVDRLVGLHPADPLVVAPLLFDLVRLAPGESVFVPAGVPHSYLSGLGVEILACSDNVLRAGLTNKPIAVPELLEVIDCRPVEQVTDPAVPLSASEVAWRPPIEDFQLTRLRVRGSVAADPSVTGPQILACTSGAVSVRSNGRSLSLTAGSSAFVTAEAGPLALTGEGEVFRGAVGRFRA